MEESRLIRPAGMASSDVSAIWEGPMPKYRGSRDPPLEDRPHRPCALCGTPFQPTVRRRMLCARCFTGRRS